MKIHLLILFLFGILNAYALTDNHEEQSAESSDQVVKILKKSPRKYGSRPRMANRIIRGEEAKNHSLPWMVSIRLNGTHICGGSLIGNDYVLTASRCLNFTKIAKKFGKMKYSKKDMIAHYEIVLGAHYVKTTGPKEQIFRIADYRGLKSDPDREGGVALVNDVAVIKLDRKANLTRYVSPIRLANSSIKVSTGDKVTVAGWGLSKRLIYDPKLGYVTYPEQFSNVLKVAEMMVVDQVDCANGIPYTYKEGNKTVEVPLGHPAGEDIFCTVEHKFQGMAYDRDTGGPLMFYDPISKQKVQVGILSYIFGRSGENGFSNVTYFLKEIEKMMHEIDNPLSCGIRPKCDNLEARIIKGDEVPKNSYPWVVALRYESNGGMCTGSLIHPDYVLTSGHCIAYLQKHPDVIPTISVVLGDHTRNETEPEEQVFGIKDFMTVFSYDSDPIWDDVGLIKLNGTAKLNKYVSTICLPNSPIDFSQGDKLTVAGWGIDKHITYHAEYGYYWPASSNVLKETEVLVINNEDCAHYYPGKDKYGNVHRYGKAAGENLICTREEYGEGKLIYGDSGSPLMYVDPITGQYVEVGVASYIYGRVGETAHANVSHFIDAMKGWIEIMDEKIYGHVPIGVD